MFGSAGFARARFAEGGQDYSWASQYPNDRVITPGVFNVYASGRNITASIDMKTLKKEESADAGSNTLSFTFYNSSGNNPPSAGEEIIVTRSFGAIEYAGVCLKPQQFYDTIRPNVGYRIVCQDFMWVFNGDRYSYKWAGAVSASTIAAAIVNFGPGGFTTTNIESGLDNVTDFEIINKTRGEALTMLRDRVGAQVFTIDYHKNVIFRMTPDSTTQADTVAADLSLSGDQLLQNDDLSQVRTRQRGLGVRVRIPSLVRSGSTNLPVESLEQLPTSGQILVGSRLLTFSGVSQTQKPSGIAGIAGAPTVALASSPAGGVLGAVRYAVIFKHPDGDTPPGTQSSQVTGATLAAPSAGSAAVQHDKPGSSPSTPPGDWLTGSGTITRSSTSISFLLPGAVAGTRVRIIGTTVWNGVWTIASMSGTTATINGVSSSGPSSESGYWQRVTTGPLTGIGGNYNYKFAWLSGRGISALSSSFSGTGSTASLPSVSTNSTTQGTGGNLTLTSTYYWYYTILYEGGKESAAVALTNVTLTGSNNKLTLTFNKVFTDWDDFRITGFGLYRGKAGEQIPRLVTTFTRQYLLENGYIGAGTWTYIDGAADTALGNLPASGEPTGAAMGITSLPTWSDARVTGLMILRTVAGGSTYYPLTTISSSSITSFLDTVSDAQLQANGAIPVESFGGHTVSLSSIPTGPTGTTARDIVRLLGSVWRYCGTIPDNTTTTYTDDKADDELGQPINIGGYLTGFTATTDDIAAGEVGRLHHVSDDTSAQDDLEALIGLDGCGVQEGPVIDDDTLTQDALEAACDAQLATFSAALKTATFRSRDPKLRPNVIVPINQETDGNRVYGGIQGHDRNAYHLVQRVVTTECDIAENQLPLRTVTAGPLLPTLKGAVK